MEYDNHTTTSCARGEAVAFAAADLSHQLIRVRCYPDIEQDEDWSDVVVDLRNSTVAPAAPRGMKRAALDAAKLWNGGVCPRTGEVVVDDLPMGRIIFRCCGDRYSWRQNTAYHGRVETDLAFGYLEDCLIDADLNAPDYWMPKSPEPETASGAGAESGA